jgi:hypothetical protein
MSPNEFIQHQQDMLKDQLSGLVQSRLIQSVEYQDGGNGGTTVTIKFMPEGSTIKAE